MKKESTYACLAVLLLGMLLFLLKEQQGGIDHSSSPTPGAGRVHAPHEACPCLATWEADADAEYQYRRSLKRVELGLPVEAPPVRLFSPACPHYTTDNSGRMLLVRDTNRCN